VPALSFALANEIVLILLTALVSYCDGDEVTARAANFRETGSWERGKVKGGGEVSRIWPCTSETGL